MRVYKCSRLQPEDSNPESGAKFAERMAAGHWDDGQNFAGGLGDSWKTRLLSGILFFYTLLFGFGDSIILPLSRKAIYIYMYIYIYSRGVTKHPS